MIELTDEQRKAIDSGEAIRVRDGGQEYVVLRADVYERMVADDPDDRPWTDEEMDALRNDAVNMLDIHGKKE